MFGTSVAGVSKPRTYRLTCVAVLLRISDGKSNKSSSKKGSSSASCVGLSGRLLGKHRASE